MKLKTLSYLGILAVGLWGGNVAAAEIEARPLEIHAISGAESSGILSVEEIEKETYLVLSESQFSLLPEQVSATVWTKEDKSDQREVLFERDAQGRFVALLESAQFEAGQQQVHVVVKARFADATVQTFDEYQFVWSNSQPSTTSQADQTTDTTTDTTASTTLTPKVAVVPTSQTVQGQLTIQNLNAQTGQFDVVVSGISAPYGISSVQLPIWTEENGQDDLKWYTASKQADGTYKVTVKASDHKNSRGLYHVHLYYRYTDGKQAGVTTTTANFATAVTKPTGQLTIQNLNPQTGQFDVVVSGISAPYGISSVQLPIWTDEKGQDDLKWYTASKQADGTYKVTVKASDHKNGLGLYHVHLYYSYTDGKQAGVTTTTANFATAVTKPTGQLTIQNINAQTGQFDVVVSGVSAPYGISSVQLPIWTEEKGQDDLKWYTATKQADGTYKVTVKASDHKNGFGLYHVHLYYSYINGKQVGVTGSTTTLPEAAAAGKIRIQNQNHQFGTFDVIVSDVVSPKGVKAIQIPVWSDVHGQDDLKWYTATKQSDGTYKVTVKASDHKYSTGRYQAHLYLTQSDGKMLGLATTSTEVRIERTAPQANVTIRNIDNAYGSFDVVVSDIFAPQGVEKVSIPVWSEVNGQNDIVWYEASRQSDGTYKVTVRLSNHRYETGAYNAHAYIESKGQTYGVATTKAKVTYTKKAGQSFIDISSHNGSLSVSDYHNLIAKGVAGVVVKLTEGTSYTNPFAAEQIRNAQAVGLKVSVYHYSHFTDTASAQAEARYFANAARQLGLSTSIVMVNDIEEQKTRTNINANMKAWEAEMRRLGYTNLVHYTGGSWLDKNPLGIVGPIQTSQFGMSNFWVAHYPYVNGMSVDQARQLKFYDDAAAWQFTSKALLLAGHTYFDLNLDYTGRFTN